MDTKTAPAKEQSPGFMDQFRDACLGKVLGMIVLGVLAFIGLQVANALGVADQKGSKGSLLLYGMVGAAACVVGGLPVWLAVKWIKAWRKQG